MTDSDLIEARRIVEENGVGGIPYSEGNDDWRPAIKIALIALRRGRELGCVQALPTGEEAGA